MCVFLITLPLIQVQRGGDPGEGGHIQAHASGEGPDGQQGGGKAKVEVYDFFLYHVEHLAISCPQNVPPHRTDMYCECWRVRPPVVRPLGLAQGFLIPPKDLHLLYSLRVP